jgi:hypothetical protein
LIHVTAEASQRCDVVVMLELPIVDTALRLLRQALDAGASAETARLVVLRKLTALFRDKSDNDLRNALAQAWARHRCRD